MQNSDQPNDSGSPYARIAAQLFRLLATRAQLFGAELHMARARLMRMLLWFVFAVLALCMAVFFVGMALVFALWQVHPVLAMLAVAGLLGGGAFVAYLKFKRLRTLGGAWFGATVEVFRADRASVEDVLDDLQGNPNRKP